MLALDDLADELVRMVEQITPGKTPTRPQRVIRIEEPAWVPSKEVVRVHRPRKPGESNLRFALIMTGAALVIILSILLAAHGF